MWHVSECEPRSFSDPNNKPLPGFQWWATQSGSALWREIDISLLAPQSVDCLCISQLQQPSEALTDLHLHLLSSDLTTASWHSLILSHFLLHWSQWAHTDNPPLPHIFIHKMRRNTRMHSTESGKKADVDKLNGSTVNVVCEHNYMHLYVYTVHVSMHHAMTNVFRFLNVCGRVQGNTRGLWEYILLMQIREHLLEVFLLLYCPTVLCQTLCAIKSLL